MAKKSPKPSEASVKLKGITEGIESHAKDVEKNYRIDIAKRNKTIANLRDQKRLLEHKAKEQEKEIASLNRELRKYTEPPIPEIREIDRTINYRFVYDKIILPE